MIKPGSKSAKKLTTYQASRAIQRPVSDAARDLNEKVSGRMKIRWNSRTGTPRSIRGVLTEPEKGTVQEIARRFLIGNRQLFGMREDLADLQYVQTTERRGIRHVTFRQVYQDLPVSGAELTVHLDQVDRVQMVNGEYHAGIEVDLSAAPISKTTAIQAVLADLGIQGPPPADVQAKLVIFPQGAIYGRAYQVSLNTKVPLGNWVYFVDASSGKVVDSYNALCFLKGRGSIYNANPKRDDNQVVTAELFDLKGDRTLSGSYFKVENDAGPEAMAPSDKHEFLYSSDNTHFDEVMVYYHLSKVGEFFRNLGYPPQQNPMIAHVHVADPDTHSPDYDNAYYSPFEHALYLGHGKVFNDFAKEEAVIYHEYTHAVIDAAQSNMATNEAGALHEGYADYFACSITDDPQIGEFVVERLGEPNLRNLRKQKTYQDFTDVDVHADGEIWGITCWKLREALGARVADLLMYESLWFLPPNATFVDASDGIVQADTSLFSADHVAEIEDILSEQKILVKPAETYAITAIAGSGGSISPSGEVIVKHGADQVFAIAANPGYTIKDVVVDGASVGAVASYAFTQVTSTHTIAAQFQTGAVAERTLIVPGNTLWMDTGMMIAVGDIITFTAHGTVVYDKRGNSCGPGGASWTDVQDKKDPLWQKPHAGLIGKIEGSVIPFFIGTASTIKAGGNGKLFLGINDYWYQGNTGEFTITIRIAKGS